MRKVLMIATVPSMIGQFNMENISILLKLGYEVHVACNWTDNSVWTNEKNVALIKKLKEQNISIIQIDFSRSLLKFGKHYKCYNNLLSVISSNKYEFVHCHTPIASAIARVVCKKTNTKCIYTAHGFHFYKGAPIINWLIFYPLEKKLSTYTDVLITINKEDYNRAKRKFNMKQLEYVPGVGIDTKKFALKNFDKLEYRQRLGLKEDDFAILSVGELNKNKNHEIVIKSIAKLKNNRIHYYIAGRGKLKNRLTELSRKEEIESQVHFLNYRNDIAELDKSVNLYVLPSIREGLNVSLIEAISSGTICIASNIRGNQDLLEDNYLFNPRSTSDCVLCIKKAINKELENNINVEKYDKKNISKKMTLIYMFLSN